MRILNSMCNQTKVLQVQIKKKLLCLLLNQSQKENRLHRLKKSMKSQKFKKQKRSPPQLRSRLNRKKQKKRLKKSQSNLMKSNRNWPSQNIWWNRIDLIVYRMCLTIYMAKFQKKYAKPFLMSFVRKKFCKQKSTVKLKFTLQIRTTSLSKVKIN